MEMIFKSFSKKLFGIKYEKLIRSLIVWPMVFWGLYIAGLKVQINSSVLYLMIGTFTAGVMWQALSSEDNAEYMQNMFMLPFENRKFIFSYVAALGTYTLFTKTAALLAVLLAVSDWNVAELTGSVFCAVNAVLMAAAAYSAKKHWHFCVLWAVGLTAAILFCGNHYLFLLLPAANGLLSAVLLQKADGYSFYLREGKSCHTVKGHKKYSVWRYFFRYMKYHKNYLVNTVGMWCAACVLPLLFSRTENLFVAPMGFAILSLNTPICILLSCDPALEQAVRFLPGQKRAFCVPYCLFIFLCNMTADTIFLCSLQLQKGGVTLPMLAAALFFALQSAVCSVLLEWFYPLRGWKIESDLWHHPRKYIVPAAMLFLAGAVGTLPVLMPVLLALLAAEIAILLLWCRKPFGKTT